MTQGIPLGHTHTVKKNRQHPHSHQTVVLLKQDTRMLLQHLLSPILKVDQGIQSTGKGCGQQRAIREEASLAAHQMTVYMETQRTSQEATRLSKSVQLGL